MISDIDIIASSLDHEGLPSTPTILPSASTISPTCQGSDFRRHGGREAIEDPQPLPTLVGGLIGRSCNLTLIDVLASPGWETIEVPR